METFGDSGSLIWIAFDGDRLDAGAQALVRELARCADTLDKLDGLVAGRKEEWATLVFDDMGEIHLVVDKLLEVRRNHQLTLKALHAEVRAAGLRPKADPEQGEESEEEEDQLAKRRRERMEREQTLGG